MKVVIQAVVIEAGEDTIRDFGVVRMMKRMVDVGRFAKGPVAREERAIGVVDERVGTIRGAKTESERGRERRDLDDERSGAEEAGRKGFVTKEARRGGRSKTKATRKAVFQV